MDSPDWIKNKKATINQINKKRSQMLSTRCNDCYIKSLRNRKTS